MCHRMISVLTVPRLSLRVHMSRPLLLWRRPWWLARRGASRSELATGVDRGGGDDVVGPRRASRDERFPGGEVGERTGLSDGDRP